MEKENERCDVLAVAARRVPDPLPVDEGFKVGAVQGGLFDAGEDAEE